MEPIPETDSLAAALARHKLALPPEQEAKLAEYCRLLWEWNDKLNLTRHIDFEKFVSRDCLDSAKLAGLLKPGQKVLDVGSGGGVPGIIVAILRPDVSVVLSESIEKKAKALGDMVGRLKLPIQVVHGRAEDYLEEHKADVVTARAVGPMAKILRWFQPYWPRLGELLLIKGPKWLDERGEARHFGLLKDLELRKAAEYPMPGTDSQSVILRIFPHREGTA